MTMKHSRAQLGHITWNHDVMQQCERIPMGHSHVLRITDKQLSELICQQLQRMHEMKPRRGRFPGCQPVSLMREHLPFLMESEYWISPKPDGTRYMIGMLLLHVTCDLPGWKPVQLVNGTVVDEIAAVVQQQPTVESVQPIVCLMDRKCQVYIVPGVKAPLHLFPACLDGELVRDKVGQWRYLLFELIYVHGLPTGHFAFAERLKLMRTLAPMFQLADTCFIRRLTVKEQFRKDQFLMVKDRFLNREFEYDTDGEVLTPNNVPVRFGTNWLCFKIKCAIDNTIDVELRRSSSETLLMRVTGEVVHAYASDPHEYIPGKPQQFKLIHPADFFSEREQRIDTTLSPELLQAFPNDTWVGRIAECYISPQGGDHVIKSIRDDKEHPNNALTVFITKLNMRENLSTQVVFDILQHHFQQTQHMLETTACRPTHQKPLMTGNIACEYFHDLLISSNWTPKLIASDALRDATRRLEFSWQARPEDHYQRTIPITSPNAPLKPHPAAVQAIINRMQDFGVGRMLFSTGKTSGTSRAPKRVLPSKKARALLKKQRVEGESKLKAQDLTSPDVQMIESLDMEPLDPENNTSSDVEDASVADGPAEEPLIQRRPVAKNAQPTVMGSAVGRRSQRIASQLQSLREQDAGGEEEEEEEDDDDDDDGDSDGEPNDEDVDADDSDEESDADDEEIDDEGVEDEEDEEANADEPEEIEDEEDEDDDAGKDGESESDSDSDNDASEADSDSNDSDKASDASEASSDAGSDSDAEGTSRKRKRATAPRIRKEAPVRGAPKRRKRT